jgi:hypothetical protein
MSRSATRRDRQPARCKVRVDPTAAQKSVGGAGATTPQPFRPRPKTFRFLLGLRRSSSCGRDCADGAVGAQTRGSGLSLVAPVKPVRATSDERRATGGCGYYYQLLLLLLLLLALLATGYCWLEPAVVCWLLATGCWLLATGYWLELELAIYTG